MAEASLRMKRQVVGFTGPVADHLLGYSWPGNIRELANVMERAVAVTLTSRVGLEDLPPELRLPLPGTISLAPGTLRSLEDIEKEYILAVLEAKKGNRTHAASTLKIGAATLHRKLKSYKVNP